jgi:hypothetical protein
MNKTIPYLKNAKALPDYKVLVEFEDEVQGIVDLSHLKGKGVFEWWEKDDNFSKMQVNKMGNIVWNDDIDIDVLNCYLKITNQTFEEYADS